MVEDMEAELNRPNSDFVVVEKEQSSSQEVIQDTESEEMKEKIALARKFKTPQPTSHKKVPKVSADAPKVHVPETPISDANVSETPIADVHVLVPETPISNAPPETPISIAQAPATSTPVLRQHKRFSLTDRKKSRNSMSFTLSGRIKKKKQSSTIFIQLGKLAPLFTSKNTTVKLVIPNKAKARRRSSGVGNQTPEVKKVRDSFAQTSQAQHSVGVQMTQAENVMHSVGVQSSQKNVTCSAQTSQIDRSSIGVQITQVRP